MLIVALLLAAWLLANVLLLAAVTIANHVPPRLPAGTGSSPARHQDCRLLVLPAQRVALVGLLSPAGPSGCG